MHVFNDGDCLEIFSLLWQEVELAESATEPGVYRAIPPGLESLGDLWMGYFVQLHFPGGNTDDWLS